MNKTIKRSINVLVMSIMSLSVMSVVVGDDTDIINTTLPPQSNVLFVMDMSGSMAWRLGSDDLPVPPEKSRKDELSDALSTVLNSPILTGLDMNVGLASFAGYQYGFSIDNQQGHGISYPISPLNDSAAPILDSNPLWNHQTSIYDGETVTSYLPLAGSRSSIGYMGISIPSTWDPYGKTPIVDALYEAALYFRGAPVDYGKAEPSRKNSAHPSTYTGLLYNKTTLTGPLVSEECGGSTGITCNSTVDSCPTTTVSTIVCLASDSNCTIDAVSTGYTCGAFYTPPSAIYGCSYSDCSANATCDSTSSTPTVYPRLCTLSSASACETANPTWDVGSCVARTIPATTTGGLPIYDAEGDITGYTPIVSVPAYTVYDCTETIDMYQCTSFPVPRQDCTKSASVCHHNVNSAVTTLTGTADYNSPIISECANNSIVLLSDGTPTVNHAATKVQTLIGSAYANDCQNDVVLGSSDPDPGRCGKELTKFLADTDNSVGVTGKQVVRTHTIGLSLGTSTKAIAAEAYLKDLAKEGKGEFVNASSSSGLVTALLNAMTSNPRAHSFTSPTYTKSTTRLSRGEDVYLPVFDKSIGPMWSGNLKKYKRSGGRLIDADLNNATNSLGVLEETARDYWSTVASTSAVLSGGVANQLPAAINRHLYTDAGATSGVVFGVSNELKSSNTSITKSLLGDATMTDAYRDKLISFIRGVTPDGATERKHIGDIIHSKPVYVDYGATKRLYVGTNEGYLHAFDESTGVEEYAFMPEVLLKNINTQLVNDAMSPHVYGVDGPITLQHNDINHDGIVNGSDTAVLYFGLRRGGKAYYALDITSPSAPKLLWKVKKDSGDFSNLGYTWSQPVVMNMKHSAGSAEQVVIFGGGYVDDSVDSGGVTVEADNSGTGANVFIVKASDGSLVWKLTDSSKTELTNAGIVLDYAVPATIRAMDINDDGSLDRLYFGDTGGNVWRVDFESNLTGANSSKAKLKQFANLGGAGLKRKFFTEPDVAIFKSQGKFHISVAIGSGQRPKPLDTLISDNFFLMFDENIFTSPTALTPTITKTNLKDATSGPVTDVLSGGFRGWYMDLTMLNGEKVLSRATTYNNKVLFNTFGTMSVVATACSPSNVNRTRLYILDLMNAGGVVDLDNNSTIDPAAATDRSVEITEGEIPGAPQIIINEPTSCTQGNCALTINANSGRGLDVPLADPKVIRRVFWLDAE